MIDTYVYESSSPGQFLARGGYDLLFIVDMVALNSRLVGGGGLEQKVLFSRMLKAKSRSASGASHQPDFLGSCLLVKRVWPVYLVDRFS